MKKLINFHKCPNKMFQISRLNIERFWCGLRIGLHPINTTINLALKKTLCTLCGAAACLR